MKVKKMKNGQQKGQYCSRTLIEAPLLNVEKRAIFCLINIFNPSKDSSPFTGKKQAVVCI